MMRDMKIVQGLQERVMVLDSIFTLTTINVNSFHVAHLFEPQVVEPTPSRKRVLGFIVHLQGIEPRDHLEHYLMQFHVILKV